MLTNSLPVNCIQGYATGSGDGDEPPWVCESWLSAPEAEPCTSQERKISGNGISDRRPGASEGRTAFFQGKLVEKSLESHGQTLAAATVQACLPATTSRQLQLLNECLQDQGPICSDLGSHFQVPKAFLKRQ